MPFSPHVYSGQRTRWDPERQCRVFAEGPNEGQPSKGRDGFCDLCQHPVQHGEPDPCLGYLHGVAYACCGHGKGEAYVVLGSGPNGPRSHSHGLMLRRAAAMWFFNLFGRGPHATKSNTKGGGF